MESVHQAIGSSFNPLSKTADGWYVSPRPPPRPPFISSEVLKSYSKSCTKKEQSPVRILLESIAHAAAPSPGPGAAPWSQAAGSSQVQLTIFTYYTGGKRKPHIKLNLGKKNLSAVRIVFFT